MRRWMLPIVAVALLGPAAIADDSSDSTPRPTFPLIRKKKPAAKPAQPAQPIQGAKVIRVVVLEEAQPTPAGPSAATAPAAAPPAVIEPAPVAPLARIDSGCDDGSNVVRSKGLFAKKKLHSENCAGCGSFYYEMWYAFSSCRSFFSEGPYRPRYPDNCPSCGFGCKHNK